MLRMQATCFEWEPASKDAEYRGRLYWFQLCENMRGASRPAVVKLGRVDKRGTSKALFSLRTAPATFLSRGYHGPPLVTHHYDGYGCIGKPGGSQSLRYLPASPYAASKVSVDMVRVCGQMFRLPVNITRCPNNFGLSCSPYQGICFFGCRTWEPFCR